MNCKLKNLNLIRLAKSRKKLLRASIRKKPSKESKQQERNRNKMVKSEAKIEKKVSQASEIPDHVVVYVGKARIKKLVNNNKKET